MFNETDTIEESREKEVALINYSQFYLCMCMLRSQIKSIKQKLKKSTKKEIIEIK